MARAASNRQAAPLPSRTVAEVSLAAVGDHQGARAAKTLGTSQPQRAGLQSSRPLRSRVDALSSFRREEQSETCDSSPRLSIGYLFVALPPLRLEPALEPVPVRRRCCSVRASRLAETSIESFRARLVKAPVSPPWHSCFSSARGGRFEAKHGSLAAGLRRIGSASETA